MLRCRQRRIRTDGTRCLRDAAIDLHGLPIPMAETVRLEMPEVQLSTTEAMTGHLREWIMKGEVDLALLCDNASFGDCASSLLVTEDLRFYSTDEDRPLSTPPEEPADLTDVAATDLVLPSEKDGLCIFIERAARAELIGLNISIAIGSMTQIKALMAPGSCYTVLSPAAVHAMAPAGTLVGAPIRCREVVADLVKRKFWLAELLPREQPVPICSLPTDYWQCSREAP